MEEDRELVRKLARDVFGPIVDLSDHEKAKLRGALKKSKNVSLSECRVAANENGIDADTRQLLKLRNEILQERMSEIMSALKLKGEAIFDEMDQVTHCAACGSKLQPVRPGKWQCPECE